MDHLKASSEKVLIVAILVKRLQEATGLDHIEITEEEVVGEEGTVDADYSFAKMMVSFRYRPKSETIEGEIVERSAVGMGQRSIGSAESGPRRDDGLG